VGICIQQRMPVLLAMIFDGLHKMCILFRAVSELQESGQFASRTAIVGMSWEVL
jgi:hypothetical protein